MKNHIYKIQRPLEQCFALARYIHDYGAKMERPGKVIANK